MSEHEAPKKVKIIREAKPDTRAKAIRKLHDGADPESFLTHKNYHVRKIAWLAAGANVPTDKAEREKLAASLSPRGAAKLIATWTTTES